MLTPVEANSNPQMCCFSVLIPDLQKSWMINERPYDDMDDIFDAVGEQMIFCYQQWGYRTRNRVCIAQVFVPYPQKEAKQLNGQI